MQNPAPLAAPSEVLRRALVDRVARNPAYSLRAFARDLGISHAYMSLVLSGKRPIPLKRALGFSQAMGLSYEESLAFLDNCRRAQFERKTEPVPAKAARPAPDDFFRVQLDQFRVLSDWYYVAILDLTLLDDFQPNERWVADRLGLTLEEVRGAVARLKRLGLLTVSKGKWKKRQSHFEVAPVQSVEAIRKFHAQMIEKALAALANPEAYAGRDITGMTMAINPARLPEAKKRIQKFRRSLMKYLTRGECTEVYQMNVQVFPLTKPRSRS